MSERKDNLFPDGDSASDQPSWFQAVESKVPTLQLFPHCKLGDGFAQYAIGSDTGCILVWEIDGETDIDEAAFSLEKAKASLVKDEPCSEQTMMFIVHPRMQMDTSVYEKRNIQCLTERQFVKFAADFFSETKEQIRLGKAAYCQGHYKIAFRLLAEADVDDDADALFMVGQILDMGKGVGKDRKASEDWYWRAAQLGHAGAVIEVEKSANRKKASWKRQEQKFIDEVEEFTKRLLSEDE